MPDLITDTDQVTPDWLEGVLRRAGCLPRGRVHGLRASARETTTSRVLRLSVQYAGEAPDTAPRRLLLKLSRPGFHPQFGEQEVAFYTQVAPAMPHPPIVRCYDAAYCPDRKQSHLLLGDLSETHAGVASRPPAPRETCARIVRCLARFHAFWWDHPRLGRDIGSPPEPPNVARLEEHVAGFLSFLGDQLSGDQQRIYRQVARTAGDRWQRRLASGRHLALIHGDAHFENFLVPHHESDAIRIIDWQFWNVSVGPQDLAFMIARNWTRDQRRGLELDLLRLYHQELVCCGVEGYTWELCWSDYREWAIENVLIPMWQWVGQLTPSTDWDGLRQAFDAFEDLACEEAL
jgi:thiamine kinase-like enzyme